MTAVIGIMNKRGIAIAADSAVTMTRKGNQKISNSANKMLRLSSANPISVMITGNAEFLRTPWDIVVRRYRQKRGDISFPTVEACIDDFFAYIVTEPMFLPEEVANRFFRCQLNDYWDEVDNAVPRVEVDEKDVVTNGEELLKAFHDRIGAGIKYYKGYVKMPMFKDYTLEQFKKYADKIIDDLFLNKTRDEDDSLPFLDDEFGAIGSYPKYIMDQIKDEFTECFYYYATNAWSMDSTHLIFSGFGADEENPVLVRAIVDGGFDSRVCYHINEDDIYKISDENPVAICPFAQDDIMEALLTGVHGRFCKIFYDKMESKVNYFMMSLPFGVTNHDFEKSQKLQELLSKVKYRDLVEQDRRYCIKLRNDERLKWTKALNDYDLQAMASLAENMVSLTGFERHLTFKDEGVGGLVDLAVITKNDGFIWLNRKSWYHRKDVGGKYGKFGV